MELIEISSNEYGQIVGDKGPVFCRKDFLELNKTKVDAVHYFLGRDKKNRLAFALGEKDCEWRAPYSAPFAIPIELQKVTPIEYYWEFIELLNKFAVDKGIKHISILLPPDIYYWQSNAKIINALLGKKYEIEYEELNYSINLKKIRIEDYAQLLQCNARRNLKIALNSGLSLFRCLELEEKKAAYEVIRVNHESRGYPLRMTLEQVLETIISVKHDIFLVKRCDITLAAAIVFHINDKIVQVIYWGNVPNVEEYKPMNFLAYELIKFYKEQGIDQIDIGPSSESGFPNYGLCTFKESIGCEVTSKFRLSICLEGENVVGNSKVVN